MLQGLDSTYAHLDRIVSRNEEDHRKQLSGVFERLREYGIVINKSKCELGKPEKKKLTDFRISDNTANVRFKKVFSYEQFLHTFHFESC